MIHAAITAVALSCSPSNSIQDVPQPTKEMVAVEFSGGSIAEYVVEITEAFATIDDAVNVVLLPGTDKIEIPSISLAVNDPADALAAIADHHYDLADGTRIFIELEQVGVHADVIRLSGKQANSSNPRRGSNVRTSTVVDDRGVSILRVDRNRQQTVGSLVKKVLDIAGILKRSTIVPVPEHDLLLVASTSKGRDLVEKIVFEAASSNAEPLPKPKKTATPKSGRRDEVRKMLKDLALRRQDTSLTKDEQLRNSRRFVELLSELRRPNDS